MADLPHAGHCDGSLPNKSHRSEGNMNGRHLNVTSILRRSPRTPTPRWSQAQRTLASGRAARARPAATGMLGAHTAAVKR